jgi:CO/xanthine dehydrogenase Mo-binding subunit
MGAASSAPTRTKKRGKAIAVTLKTSRTPSTSTASCKLNEDGSLSVLTSSVEMGQGAKTALSQIAAEAVGVDYGQVSVSEPDTDLTPYDQATSSSRTTYSMGTAIRLAAQEIRQQLAELAAAELEVAPHDVDLADGQASVRGAPERSLSYGALVRKGRRGNLIGNGTFVSAAEPDPLSGEPGVSAHWHHGVGAAEVEVDTETGRVTVLRYHGGMFAGRIINPQQCELQAEGSIVFGLGQSLMEAMVFDDGRLTNPNLSDYMIPSFEDLPPLDVNVLEHPGSDDIHGVGETTQPPVAAVITSAIADAIGVDLFELPLTPERVLRALREKQAAGG